MVDSFLLGKNAGNNWGMYATVLLAATLAHNASIMIVEMMSTVLRIHIFAPILIAVFTAMFAIKHLFPKSSSDQLCLFNSWPANIFRVVLFLMSVALIWVFICHHFQASDFFGWQDQVFTSALYIVAYALSCCLAKTLLVKLFAVYESWLSR